MENTTSGTHFILVHGLGHGAWCWYKVVVALEAAGHRVTAVDLAASGAHPARVDEVHSFDDYSRPLLDLVAAAPEGGERLILVGHSHGGLSLTLAMERFPRKVATAVFVAAAMPCVGKHMGITTEEFMRRTTSLEYLLMDSEMMAINNNQGPGVAIRLGPEFLARKYYQQSPAEDLALGKMLVRPGNQFLDDPVMKDTDLLTVDNYGSVKKVYVVAKADESSTEEMQRWMITLSPGVEVVEITEINDADMEAQMQAPIPVQQNKRKKKEVSRTVKTVRRSDRLAELAKGFKNQKSAEEAGTSANANINLTAQFEATLIDKNGAPPPHLPVDTLQVIGASHCKMPSTMLSEAALNYNSADDSE